MFIAFPYGPYEANWFTGTYITIDEYVWRQRVIIALIFIVLLVAYHLIKKIVKKGGW
jgi:hypothetical protein